MINGHLKKLLVLLVTIFWFVSMGMLFTSRYVSYSSPNISNASIPEGFFKERWFGIYQGGQRIGYSSSHLKKVNGGYRSAEFAFIRIKMMGELKEISTLTETYLDEGFKLKSFSFDMKSDVNIKVSGIVEKGELVVKVDGGVKLEQRLPLRDIPNTSVSLVVELLKSGLKEGQTVRLPVIEPSSLTQDTMELKVVGKETLLVMGKEVEAFKLKGLFMGADIFIWITPDGDIVKEETIVFVSLLEEKSTAMSIGYPQKDIISGEGVSFNKELPNDVKYLKVRISGIDLKGLSLQGGTQILNGNVLEVYKANPKDMKETQKVSDEYLKPTLFVQSDNPEIIDASKKIVKNETDTLKKSKLIYDWVYKNVKKVPAVTIPSAVEVLKSMRGDCNEHTTLYTALARASLIPTRIATGVVYKDGTFYYHAWPEVYVNGWLPIDPTLGEFPADASHIRLLTGDIDEQIRLISIIGRLKLKGLGSE